MITLLIISSIYMHLHNTDATLLYKASKNNYQEWKIINDDVMGGISYSRVTYEDNSVCFNGSVSTENNGGFASIKNYNIQTKSDKQKTLKLYLKGDGKTYQVRIKSNSSSYYSYVRNFKTSGEWESINLELNSFRPSFRGQYLKMPNYSDNYISEVSILISNGKDENFKLFLSKIELL